MHITAVLSILLQVACAVHAIKTGRPYWWLFIIFFVPIVGPVVYLIVEVLPEFRRGGGRIFSGVAKTIDPNRDLRQRADELALSNTVENKVRLADECLRTGDYQRAAELYESSLTGVHKDDPKVMLGLAQAQFRLGQYSQTKDLLDRLIQANPDFKSPEGHLLYARSLEEMRDVEAALEEYRVLAGYYPGIEAKCRYALLLKLSGRKDEAREIFSDIVLSAKQFRHFYKSDDKHWIQIARENLAETER